MSVGNLFIFLFYYIPKIFPRVINTLTINDYVITKVSDNVSRFSLCQIAWPKPIIGSDFLIGKGPLS